MNITQHPETHREWIFDVPSVLDARQFCHRLLRIGIVSRREQSSEISEMSRNREKEETVTSSKSSKHELRWRDVINGGVVMVVVTQSQSAIIAIIDWPFIVLCVPHQNLVITWPPDPVMAVRPSRPSRLNHVMAVVFCMHRNAPCETLYISVVSESRDNATVPWLVKRQSEAT